MSDGVVFGCGMLGGLGFAAALFSMSSADRPSTKHMDLAKNVITSELNKAADPKTLAGQEYPIVQNGKKIGGVFVEAVNERKEKLPNVQEEVVQTCTDVEVNFHGLSIKRNKTVCVLAR